MLPRREYRYRVLLRAADSLQSNADSRIIAAANPGFFMFAHVATKETPVCFPPIKRSVVPFVQVDDAGIVTGFFVG